MGRTAKDYLDVLRGWLGYSESNGKHKQIIDIYNSHKPLARGYAVKASMMLMDCSCIKQKRSRIKRDRLKSMYLF